MSESVAAAGRPRWRFAILLALAAMLAMHGWVFYTLRQEVEHGYADFTAFYGAGKCLQTGQGSRLYDPQTQARVQEQFSQGMKTGHGPLPYIHPPFEALLFAPLARLSYLAAYVTWNAINVAALIVFLLTLGGYLPHLRQWSAAFPILAAFAFFPVFVCLLQGQDSLLLLLMMGLAFVAAKKDREYLSGACLGFALFRFQMVLPLLAVALLRRKWKVLTGVAVVALALGAVSILVVGWSETWRYPWELLELSRVQSGATMNPRAMPNLRGAIFGLLGGGVLTSVATALLSVILVGFAAIKWKFDSRDSDFNLGFALTLTVAVMASYHLMAHDLTLLLLPILLTADWLCSASSAEPARRFLIVATCLLFFSPAYFLAGFRYGHMNTMFWLVALLGTGLAVALRQQPALAGAGAASVGRGDAAGS